MRSTVGALMALMHGHLASALQLPASFATPSHLRAPAAAMMAADEFVLKRLAAIKSTYNVLTAKLEDPDIMADTKELLRVNRERSKLEETVETYDHYMDLDSQLGDAKEMFAEADDAEMKELAREELKTIEEEMGELDENLKLLSLIHI